jgi:hypothetical protein
MARKEDRSAEAFPFKVAADIHLCISETLLVNLKGVQYLRTVVRRMGCKHAQLEYAPLNG